MIDNRDTWEFMYRDHEDNLTIFSFQDTDGMGWDKVIYKFVGFVEQVYGYEIKDKIKIMQSPVGYTWTNIS